MNWFKRAEGGEEGEGGFRHLRRWRTPRYYHGESWDGWYAAPVGHSRDSDTVESSNWQVQLERIPESETVQVVSENHWAVGWVEWLAIHESDRGALAEAERVGDELENYPILDEDHHSQLEWTTMTESGMILDGDSGKWVDEIEGRWEGRLEGISLPGMDGVVASGTFIIRYRLSKSGVEVDGVEPVDVEMVKPRGRAAIVSGGRVLNPGLAKAVVDELMHLGSEADDERIFDRMCGEVRHEHGL